MSTTTTNLGLVKPAYSDAGDIAVINSNMDTIDTAFGNILKSVYPIGAIYMSVSSTAPSTLFPGTTWVQLQDRFLLAAGSTYTAASTGGAASRTYTPAGSVGNHKLTISEIPSHTHTFTGSAVTSGANSVGHTHSMQNHTHGMQNHTHGMKSHTHTLASHTHSITGHTHSLASHTHSIGSHTHTYSKSATTTGSAGAGSTSSVALTVDQIPSHTHAFKDYWGVSAESIDRTAVAWNGAETHAGSTTTAATGGSQGHSHTISNHTHSITLSNTNSGGSGILNTMGSGILTTGSSGTLTSAGPSTNTSGGPSDNTTGAPSNNTTTTPSNNTTGGVSANHTHSVTAAGSNSNTGGGGNHNHGFTGTQATIQTMPPYLAVYMWKRTA